MKNLPLLLWIICVACTDSHYPEYKLARDQCVPDSLKEPMRQWALKAVEATNHQLTAGDYEHPEYVLEHAASIAAKMYAIPCDGLYKKDCNGCSWEFVPQPYFTEEEKLIFKKFYERSPKL